MSFTTTQFYAFSFLYTFRCTQKLALCGTLFIMWVRNARELFLPLPRFQCRDLNGLRQLRYNDDQSCYNGFRDESDLNQLFSIVL